MRGLIVMFIAASAYAQALQGIYIFQWGEYQADGRVPNPVLSPQGIELNLDTSNALHLRTTRVIVARIGTEFCFRFWPLGVLGARVPIRIFKHFPAPGVIGRVSRNRIVREEDEWVVVVGLPEIWCWGLDHPDDIAPGEWRIEIWSGERKLAEQTFTLILPGMF